jgi:hypothetical protein
VEQDLRPLHPALACYTQSQKKTGAYLVRCRHNLGACKQDGEVVDFEVGNTDRAREPTLLELLHFLPRGRNVRLSKARVVDEV